MVFRTGDMFLGQNFRLHWQHQRHPEVFMIDHVGFPVSDYPRARDFYLKALAPLGYRLIMEVQQHAHDGELPLRLRRHGRSHAVLGDGASRWSRFRSADPGPRSVAAQSRGVLDAADLLLAPDESALDVRQPEPAVLLGVVGYLVARHVDKSRLRAKGYGEYCPEDPGHNEEAWEKNRRVEFKIVKTKDGPTNVELGCQNASIKGVKPDPVP